MKPIVHGLEAEFWAQVDFIYIDHTKDAAEPVMARFNAYQRPYFLLLDAEGNEIGRWVGTQDAETLRAAIQAHLDSTG